MPYYNHLFVMKKKTLHTLASVLTKLYSISDLIIFRRIKGYNKLRLTFFVNNILNKIYSISNTIFLYFTNNNKE